MKILRLIILSLFVVGLLFFLLLPTKRKVPAGELLVHCGSSMLPAIEEIAKEYEYKYRTKVVFNVGGSEVLLPNILLTKKGDIFVCHDPFADIVTEKGLMKEYKTTGYLYPVIIVAKGNPKGIHGLTDLAQPGLRVGMTDPRTSQCGKIVEAILVKKGLYEQVKKNVVVETKAHYDIANALALGQIDAGIVWNFIAVLNQEHVDAVTSASPSVNKVRRQLENYPVEIAATSEDYPLTRVTVCILNCTKDYKRAKEFLDLCASDFGRSVFVKHGYAKQ